MEWFWLNSWIAKCYFNREANGLEGERLFIRGQRYSFADILDLKLYRAKVAKETLGNCWVFLRLLRGLCATFRNSDLTGLVAVAGRGRYPFGVCNGG